MLYILVSNGLFRYVLQCYKTLLLFYQGLYILRCRLRVLSHGELVKLTLFLNHVELPIVYLNILDQLDYIIYL